MCTKVNIFDKSETRQPASRPGSPSVTKQPIKCRFDRLVLHAGHLNVYVNKAVRSPSGRCCPEGVVPTVYTRAPTTANARPA